MNGRTSRPLSVHLIFCGRRPQATVGAARLSRHCKSLKLTPTNAEGLSPIDPARRPSPVSLIKGRTTTAAEWLVMVCGFRLLRVLSF